MRLLHTRGFYFGEFYDEQIPEYAILSHRWESDEVLFQDWQAGRKKGFAGDTKIMNCCARAREDGFDWVWIDTCCIDKTSSAELSEAINSMFQWYKGSKLCYVFLSDVTARSTLAQSAWFTRGWTLQELIAPRNLMFFDREWHQIGKIRKGTIFPETFLEEIAAITGIPKACQNVESGSYQHASIAAKMSWASGRRTTRSEDMAYCLLGIFNVNMPMLYGEGEKAFRRLQLEIMKGSSDESLFAWTGEEPLVPENSNRWGLGRFRSPIEREVEVLAKHPREFAQAGDIRISTRRTGDNKRQPYAMTNLGLDFHALLIPYQRPRRKRDSSSIEKPDDKKIHYLALNCRKAGKASSLAIILRETGDVYRRIKSYSLVDCDELGDFKEERERIYLYA